MARALVRLALSRHVPVPADVWRFDRNCHGRPCIAVPACVPNVYFSLSHTRGLIACLVTGSAEAAVDVERIEYHHDLSWVARQVLSPAERTALSAPSERDWTTRFFDHWTLKEAYAKARGLGLALALSDIGFELKPDGTIGVGFGSQVADDPSAWVFWRRHLSPRHTLSVAARKDFDHGCEVILRPVTFDDTGIGLAP
jgi:4'-phosphopantetheinyl transferase